MRYFCDASVLGHGGIPSVVFGPGDIAQAHTADEWISLEALERGQAAAAALPAILFLNRNRPCPLQVSCRLNKLQPPPMTAAAHRASFFRQSGWLMFATVAGGMFMTAVHFLSKAMPEAEYGQFGAFLSVAMFIPAMPLQMVLAQQTARALRAAPGTRAVGADPGRVAGDVPGMAGGGRRGAAVPGHHHGAVEDHQPRRDLADAAGAAVHRLAADVLRRAARAAELPLDGLEHDEPTGWAGWR